MRSNSLKGVFAIALSTVFYGMVGVLSRFIGISFGIFSQSWTRNLIVCLVVLIISIIFIRDWKQIQKKDLPWILFWTISGIVASVSFFVVANYLTLGTTIILFYAGSNISGYFSGRIFFKEKLNFLKVIAILLSFFGVAIIYSFNISLNNFGYLILAFIAGFATGLWNTISKKFSNTYPQLQLVFIDGLMSFIVTLIIALILKESLPQITLTLSWLSVIFFALGQVITVLLTIYGFKRLEAQIGTLVMPLEVFWAALFGFLFFKETLTVVTIFGGIFIISGIIIPNLRIFTKSTNKLPRAESPRYS